MRAFQSDIFPKNSATEGFAIINTVAQIGAIAGPAFIGAPPGTRPRPHAVARPAPSLTGSLPIPSAGFLHASFGSYAPPLFITSAIVAAAALLFLPLVCLSRSGAADARAAADIAGDMKGGARHRV